MKKKNNIVDQMLLGFNVAMVIIFSRVMETQHEIKIAQFTFLIHFMVLYCVFYWCMLFIPKKKSLSS